MTKTSLLGSDPRKTPWRRWYLSRELNEVREGGMLIAGMRAFLVEEIASEKLKKTNQQTKEGRACKANAYRW